jgi:hypothetical protein
VEVLAVGQVVEETEHQDHMQPEGHVMQDLQVARRPARQRAGQRRGHVRAGALGVLRMQLEARGIGDQVGDHQRRDPEQDQHGLGAEAQAARPGDQAAHQGVGDRDDHQHLEGVHQRQVGQTDAAAEARELEVGHEAAGDERHGAQRDHDEAGEDRGVHPARALLVEQLALAEADLEQHPQPRARPVEAVLRLAGAQHADAVEHRVGEDPERQHDEGEHHQGSHGRPS